MNKITRVFLDIDLRNQHDGLKKVAASKGIKLDALDPGEHVLFINAKSNKIKIYSSSDTLTYIRKDAGRIDLNFIEMIPKAFDNHGKLDWNKAERLSLEKRLEKGQTGLK